MQETLLKLKEILNAEKCIYAHGGKISIAEMHKQASLNRIHIDSTGKTHLRSGWMNAAFLETIFLNQGIAFAAPATQ
jgi:hypothetical protein